MQAEIAANVPISANAATVIALVLMPASSAASGLPPMA